MKKVSILGSTGSIGTQTLDVIDRNPERFSVVALTCGRNVDLFRDQLAKYQPELAVCAHQDDALALQTEFPKIQFSYGEKGLEDAASYPCDIVVNSLMGMRGLVPTYRAIQAGADIAFANKETLVAGGNVIMKAVSDYGVSMLPVDSEHSAIFQCLEGNRDKAIRKILLTASGGPFRGWSYEQLRQVTPEMALKHPNWSMGAKITIDSASMMNEGLEMIEAKWLFDVDIHDIQVLVHPQSIIHSAVEFQDSSILAQLGVPDMRIPIAVALAYPQRLAFDDLSLNFFEEASNLSFEKPDFSVFTCLRLAIEAMEAGGTYPACMNAANEVLVQAFLDKKIGFTQIGETIASLLEAHKGIENPDLETILAVDRETRIITEKRISC